MTDSITSLSLPAKVLLAELLNQWTGDWKENQEFYINRLIPNLRKDPSTGMPKEKELLEKIKRQLTPEQWGNFEFTLKNLDQREYSIDGMIKKIRDYIASDKLKEADEIWDLLQSNFIKLPLTQHEYELLKLEIVNKLIEQKKSEVVKEIKQLLQYNDFVSADRRSLELNNHLTLEEYEELKSQCIKVDLDQLSEQLGVPIDDEKATVLATVGKDILVTARAGTGKTTLIALKVRQLIQQYSIKPEEILVLAFNKDAASQFASKINKFCQKELVDDSNCLTFHALAHRLANRDEQLLFNEKQDPDNFVRKKQDEYIGWMYEQLRDEQYKAVTGLLYRFFRALPKKLKAKDFSNQDSYLLYRRNLRHISFAGDRVKSDAEKYIADFLFEHDIKYNNKPVCYRYEWNVKKNLNLSFKYEPDFTLWFEGQDLNQAPIVVLEHWGVTEKHRASIDYMTDKEVVKYLQIADKKRIFLKEKKIALIETSVDWFDEVVGDDVRIHFENKLRKSLIKNGFTLNKIPEQEVIYKMLKAKGNLEPFYGQLRSFIVRAKKQSITAEHLELQIQNESELGERQGYFYQIAIPVYKRYQASLKQNKKIDFDDLLVLAKHKIAETDGKCTIEVFGNKQPIRSLKYVLVDEYQDLSGSFLGLLDSIRNCSPEVNLFCVGDDWQAINGFAGSDLEYFNNFQKYFRNGRKTSLLTNHRCAKNIVDYSNRVMSGLGSAARSLESRSDGSVEILPIPRVELDKNKPEYSEDSQYRIQNDGSSNYLKLCRYLKAIDLIIKNNPKVEHTLLFRTNEFHKRNQGAIVEILEKWNPQSRKLISTSTVHSYKGRENKNIVIVGAEEGSYPLLHPDNELLEILGVTIEKVIDEERRLYYVATTRAEDKLFIVYDNEVGLTDLSPQAHSLYDNAVNSSREEIAIEDIPF